MSDATRTADLRRHSGKIAILFIAVAAVGFGLYLAAQAFQASSQTVLAHVPGETRPWKLEVVNTTGETGMGLKIADHLRRLGYDVVDVRTQRSATRVMTAFIDRSGTPAALTDLQTVLELTPERFRTELDRTLVLDVSVVVGSDIRTIPAFAAAVQ